MILRIKYNHQWRYHVKQLKSQIYDGSALLKKRVHKGMDRTKMVTTITSESRNNPLIFIFNYFLYDFLYAIVKGDVRGGQQTYLLAKRGRARRAQLTVSYYRDVKGGMSSTA